MAQQFHGRGSLVAAVASSWHGGTARVLKFVVSFLCLGGVTRSRRCPQRHGPTAHICIIGRILVASSSRGRSSAVARAATRPALSGRRTPCRAGHSRTFALRQSRCHCEVSPGSRTRAVCERLQLSLWILPLWICWRKCPSSSIS